MSNAKHKNPTSRHYITLRPSLALFAAVLSAVLFVCGDSFGADAPSKAKARGSGLQSTLNSLLSEGGSSNNLSGGVSGVSCEDNPNCYCYDSCYCAPNDCRCEDDGGGG